MSKISETSFNEFCGGVIFDETLLLKSDWPHFTDCFQNSVLVWVPCAWLWITLPVYLHYLATQHGVAVPVNLLNTVKTFCGLFLFLLSTIDLIRAGSDSKKGHVAGVVYVSAGLKAGTFLIATVLVQIERRKGIITSGILWIFWLLMFIASIIPFYSKIKLEEYDENLFSFALFYIYFAFIMFGLFLHSFAEKMTRAGYYALGQKPSPEQEASFPSRLTFHWINSLIFRGYKKELQEDDLFELHPRDKSVRVVPQFSKAWEKELHTVRRLNEQYKKRQSRLVSHYQASMSNSYKSFSSSERTPLLGNGSQKEEVTFKGDKSDKKKLKEASLFKVLCKTYFLEISKGWLCKLTQDFIQFLGPMVLNVLINYTQNKENEPQWKGYVLASSFFVITVTQSTFFHQHNHIGMSLGMRIKSSLISAVYKKALTISNEAKKTSTVGEIVNLMSVDCQRIQDVTGFLWMLWSAPLQICLALALLYNTVGSSMFAGLAVLILLIPINGVMAMKQKQLQVKQMKFKDSRIKVMNEVLNGMKVLKLYAWELSFQDKILDIRTRELNVLLKAAYLKAVSTFIWTCSPFLVTLATFTTYVLTSETGFLDAQKAFVALSLFNILRFPITLLPMIVSNVVQASVSLGRIGKFLRQPDLDFDSVIHDAYSDSAISVRNGTFTWDKTMPHPTLKNINIEIQDEKLYAVVGQVGSGKSSLISAILGEMENIEGKVVIKSSVAYVAQQAWIQNATVRDNILFGMHYNAEKYDRIIEACALKPDLDILPAGDLTEIGEKGINLSGGQKQRVSLARAIYSDAEIFLLDDPLSAVDSHVGKHIFNHVISSKGLLKNKTRILVTHGVHWLPMVEKIIVMVDGRVSELGSYDELLSHDGPFAQFLKTYFTQEEESDDDKDEDPEIQAIKSKILERVDSVTSDTAATSGDEAGAKSVRRVKRAKKKTESEDKTKVKDLVKPDDKGDKLIQKETSEAGKVKMSVYIQYAKSVGYVMSLVIVFLYAAFQASSVYANIWLSNWTDDDLLKNTSRWNTSEYQNKNAMYLGVYGGLGLTQALIVLLFAVLTAIQTVRAAGRLHQAMLTNIMRSPMMFFDTTPIGRILNRFSRDVETIDNNMPFVVRMWINTIFSVISTFIVISYSTPIFLVVIIPLGLFYWLIQHFYIPTSRQLKRIESVTRSPIYSHFSETVTGASTIRAFGVSERFFKESQAKVDKNLVYYFCGIASNRWLGWRLDFLGSIVILAAAVFAVNDDGLEGGLVGLSITYALQVTATLNWMVRTTSDLETNIVSVERVKEYSETPTEAEWENPFRRPPQDWPQKGDINFLNYQARYRPGLDLVIKGITYDVQGGQKIGIVGRTGAGKSSMAVALFRLIEAAGGSIVIDGRRASDMGLHDLRSRLTILPQDPVLFSGSLRMNLDPFNLYTDEQIWTALKHAHLNKFVSELPTTIEYECGEGGQNLSVGQRQLVCLARTLLRKTKILVLDEATAAVDMETDDLIQQTIRTEFKDCTILTIAHRLNTILDYDRILVLDQGLIREYDTPDSLLKDRKSAFYAMAKDAGLV
ncbi:multidrug resistance-associated protein 1-like [Gigantopelta aegis]|uniref:multidrug resistance-associated protein 1-like n=1 Tax=Gigantopelta aegis TaxID=1735272 RepID=UPI001B889614|nr:multidrug resistance-associated protein 1-like [Gigantopelta aegis]